MKQRWCAIILPLCAAALSLLVGCYDMPIVRPPPEEDQPIGQASVVFGPYLTSADMMQPFLRFMSNRRCVAGIESLDSNKKYVNRQASFSLFHSLAVPELQSSTLRRYQLWLDDLDGGAYAIRGLPKTGEAVSIGFASGKAGTGLLEQIANGLRRLDPNAVVFTSPPFEGGVPEQPSDWETMFFGPLGDKVALGPLWFAPGSGMPAELFPEHAGEGGYWKRDVGALRLIGIDARAFSFESSTQAVMARLDRDLDPAHTQRAWTVVVLSRGVFDARVGDGRILQALGDRFETGGVDLVIGPGLYYVRTRPFSVGSNSQTRYITISDSTAMLPQHLEPREYVAAVSDQPHVGRLWADEGTLEWQIFDLAGRPLDVLTLDARRPQLEPPLSKWEVVADAQSSLTLQKEMLRITRQAARAVPDPNQPILLSLYFANPTTRNFSGRLTWNVQPGSGWTLEPALIPFDLQPGQGAVARFAVRPGTATMPPTLTAGAADVGSSSQMLHLTRESSYYVQPVPEPVRLDARFRDKEYWKNFQPLPPFQTLEGGAPASPTEVKIGADRDGLILAMSMTAKGVASANPAASEAEAHRDGPVLDDESVEIYIDPGRRGRDYFRFAINPRNVVLDESSRSGLAYNPVWRHAARFGRFENRETWDAEIRIPWEALDLPGMPEPGDEWGVQIVRRDFAAAREAAGRRTRNIPGPEISQWVNTFGDNTRPGLYGVLRFGNLSDAPSGDGARAAPEPGGFLIRGGQIPTRPGRILPPIQEPPTPDF
ncbi:MAG: hypothetical protein LIP23_10445 [Planctomycetes bacterium]|nr:hypothetical protein [Planctomycetota bacterium]